MEAVVIVVVVEKFTTVQSGASVEGEVALGKYQASISSVTRPTFIVAIVPQYSHSTVKSARSRFGFLA
jgi:hypothetical protein